MQATWTIKFTPDKLLFHGGVDVKMLIKSLQLPSPRTTVLSMSTVDSEPKSLIVHHSERTLVAKGARFSFYLHATYAGLTKVMAAADDITGDRHNKCIQLNEHMTDEGNRVDSGYSKQQSVMHIKCEAQTKNRSKAHMYKYGPTRWFNMHYLTINYSTVLHYHVLIRVMVFPCGCEVLHCSHCYS